MCVFCRSLFVLCPFSFGHCIVCPSIYWFWLPLWYLQTLHTVPLTLFAFHICKMDRNLETNIKKRVREPFNCTCRTISDWSFRSVMYEIQQLNCYVCKKVQYELVRIQPGIKMNWYVYNQVHYELVRMHIQYWCIDGKYRIYVARFRNGGKTSFSEFFHLFRADPHKFYVYRQYTNIVFILQ